MLRFKSRLLIVLLLNLCLCAGRAAEPISVNSVGLVADGEGAVGHGELPGPPAPWDFNSGVRLASHPQQAILAGVYTLLAGRDVFNMVNGSEAALSAHEPPFAGHTEAHGLEAFGVTGTFYHSFRGFAMDVNSPTDYTYDLANDLERRLYRHGEVAFYFDSGSGPQLFARNTEVVSQVTINWNSFEIDTRWIAATPDFGPDMLAVVVASTSVSSNPVTDDGTTTENGSYSGRFGLFNQNATFEFVGVPEAPVITGFGFQESGFEVQSTATPGFTYRLERSVDLVTWTALPEEQIAEANSLEFLDDTATTEEGRAFYRVRLLR